MNVKETIEVLERRKKDVHGADQQAFDYAIRCISNWDRLYNYLNDWCLGVAPDETTMRDERQNRQVMFDTLRAVMETMFELEVKEQ